MLESRGRQLPVKIYDCFSNRRFGGNVGGIVLDAGGLADGDMQRIAREINAPVTGFVTALDADALNVRFFMPTAEIAMCGHVTVGLYDYLYENGLAGRRGESPPVMKTRSGDIAVSVARTDDGGVEVMMELAPAVIEPCDIDRTALAAALRLDEAAICADRPIEIGSTGLRHLFVPIDTLAAVRDMAPDFGAVAELCRRLSVSTLAVFTLQTDDPASTLRCRDFCPAVGVDEVPVSGTTNSALACYLVNNRLVAAGEANGDIEILAEQGSEVGRPGRVRSLVRTKDGDISNLHVGGQAVLSIDGVVNL